MLVYGRIPRGPLSVLKETWIDQRDVSADLGKPVEDYMTNLRDRLKQAANWAELHARQSARSRGLHVQLQSKLKGHVLRLGRQGDRSRRRRRRKSYVGLNGGRV